MNAPTRELAIERIHERMQAYLDLVDPPPRFAAPLDIDWMPFAACAELEVRESDRLFFCGQGQSRLANLARASAPAVRCRVSASNSPFAIPRRPSSGCGAGQRPASGGASADYLAEMRPGPPACQRFGNARDRNRQ
jgi:hypothetical protein